MLRGTILWLDLTSLKKNVTTKGPEFVEIPVDAKEMSVFDEKTFKKEQIDITFNQAPIAENSLPYHDYPLLNPNENSKLLTATIQRDLNTRVVLRGDSRSIEDIKKAGGFHPKCIP